MAVDIKHKFVSEVLDNGDPTIVQSTDWNEGHDLTLGGEKLLGRYSTGNGVAQEISLGAGLEFSGTELKTNITKGDIGLGSVNNTSDANKPISTATQNALNGKASTAAVTTTVNGLMIAADKVKLNGIAAGAQVNTVTSVASKTGAVTLAKGDVGLGNVDNTSDANKPVSTAQLSALNGKAATDLSNVTQAAAQAKVGTGTMAYRNFSSGTADPSGGADGDLYLKYT